MAFYTNKIESHPETPAPFAFFNSISVFFERLMAAQTRSVEVERMQRLSDAELDSMGMSRDQIIRQVYRDVYYV